MTAPTCPDCGAELVIRRTWVNADVAWDDDTRVHLAHRAGTTCTPAADLPRDDERSAS